MGQSALTRLPVAEQVQAVVVTGGTKRKEQLAKPKKATSKYYKNSSKDDLVLRATLESITRFG